MTTRFGIEDRVLVLGPYESHRYLRRREVDGLRGNDSMMYTNRTRKNTRAFGAILTVVIILWWTHDHVLVPNGVYDYLPSINKFLPHIDIEFPHVALDYHESPYNESKVALLIENRPFPILAPLMLHMMSVVPPDWKFRFMGSPESVTYVNRSAAIRRQVSVGKLDLTYIPSNMSVAGQEMISRFLTNLWLHEVVLQPAEWLLMYQTDSILCANSLDSIDNYLDYDWVGAPWYGGSRYGGNGGLSMRRVSSIIEVLKHQHRANNSEPEDVWLTERLGHLHGYKTANGSVSFKFSGEMHWVDQPMGYHIGSSGKILNGGLFGSQEKRQKIWNWCPELKMTMDMDVEAYMGDKFCNQDW